MNHIHLHNRVTIRQWTPSPCNNTSAGLRPEPLPSESQAAVPVLCLDPQLRVTAPFARLGAEGWLVPGGGGGASGRACGRRVSAAQLFMFSDQWKPPASFFFWGGRGVG